MSEFSIGIRVVRFFAEGEAKTGNFDVILPEHLWMGLCKICNLSAEMVFAFMEPGAHERTMLIHELDALQQWFAEKKIDPTHWRRKLFDLLGKGSGTSAQPLHRSPESVATFDIAAVFAKREGKDTTNIVHLARAIIDNPPVKLSELLITMGNSNLLGPSLPKERKSEETKGGESQENGGETLRKKEERPKKRSELGETLRHWGRDLIELAKQGELEAVIGRREEMRRLGRALIQKRKGHVLLVGDPGVGRTSVVKGLAQRMASPKCAPALRGKRIIALSMPGLLTETKDRGELEERLDAILREVEADPDILLFIDDLQAVLGKVYAELNIVNLLKPAIERGKCHLICTTQTQDYKRVLLGDELITQRFEMIWIDEPSRAEALEILTGVKAGFEEHHGVTITSDALEAVVDFSLRYLPDHRLPDKALDLLDQACAQRMLQTITVKAEDVKKYTVTSTDQQENVDRAEVARVVSKRFGIPEDVLMKSDQERLKMLSQFLRVYVFGQEQAIQKISNALLTAYTERQDQKRPIASFLFVGPVGVGKTVTAKRLAEFLFGTAERLISFDLSEYLEEHQILRLLGAPPGQIGFECLGMLISALRQHPASVVLFEEIEQAHPDVMNVLLQILDKGKFTDRQGCSASFREAVVIMTTPKPDFLEKPGFLKKLITRMMPIVFFKPLNHDAFAAIANRLLSDYQEHIQDLSDVLPDILERVIDQIESLRSGAEQLEQIIRAEVMAWLLRRNEPVDNRIGAIMFTTIQAMASKDVALMVIDLVGSTLFLLNFGDTSFYSLISKIDKRFKQHASAPEMTFLKCTGDGFLSVFTSVPAAFAVAASFLETPLRADVHVHIALHWGNVKISPDGDVLGKEVHRLCRIEGVKVENQVAPVTDETPLPLYDRILVTKAGLERLGAGVQKQFKPAGQFRLKGFTEPCELWVFSRL